MRILAPAKVNLCLDVLCKTPKGFHKVQTVMQEISDFFDEIKILGTKEQDNMSIEYAPNFTYPNFHIKMKENLAYKALRLIKSTYKIKKNVKITIIKRIPIASGLGGAASDAAAVLKGLNKLWKLNLSQKELLKLAEKLGSDVPFFIIGGTALGTHFGEKITPLKPIKCIKFKINPPSSWPRLPKGIIPTNKTKKMYQSLNLSLCGKNTEKTKTLLEGIEKQDKNLILKNLHNDFETLISTPKNARLSGSGPAVFEVI